jgi:hypothetical protein
MTTFSSAVAAVVVADNKVVVVVDVTQRFDEKDDDDMNASVVVIIATTIDINVKSLRIAMLSTFVCSFCACTMICTQGLRRYLNRSSFSATDERDEWNDVDGKLHVVGL